MKLTVLSYQCDNCGLCCTSMLARATIVDAMREPRIAQDCPRAKVDGRVEDWYMLNAYEGGGDLPACRYHTGSSCSIYSTRPGSCVGFQAGSPDCQGLRQGAGLLPLVPVAQDVEEERYIEFEKSPQFEGEGALHGGPTRG